MRISDWSSDVCSSDLNAFEFNDGYGDSMGTVTGLPRPDDTTVVPGDGADLVDPDLYDLTFLHTPDVTYSSAFDVNVPSLAPVLPHPPPVHSADLDHLQLGSPQCRQNGSPTLYIP